MTERCLKINTNGITKGKQCERQAEIYKYRTTGMQICWQHAKIGIAAEMNRHVDTLRDRVLTLTAARADADLILELEPAALAMELGVLNPISYPKIGKKDILLSFF
jgi:hypothetical protein